jgi:lipopolysaccharide transport system permease protein
LLDAYRDVLLEGRAPNLTALLGLFLATMVLLPLGYQIFRRQSDRFVEEI